jgi:bacterioferritin B
LTRKGLPDLSAHFYERAEKEKKHALRIIQSVIDAGARVNIPTVFTPRAHFKVAEDAIKLSLEQEERVSIQIDALASMARAAHFMDDFKTSESDTTIANLLQWLVKKQSEEVASMGELLRAIQPAGEGNLLRMEEHLAHEKDRGIASIELGRVVISKLSGSSEIVLLYKARFEGHIVVSEQEVDEIVFNTKPTPEAGKVVEAIVPDALLREILKHIENETAKIRESIADSFQSKARRQRDLNRAEAEICVDLKIIQSHNNGVMPDVPALAKAWEDHRAHAFLTTSHA